MPSIVYLVLGHCRRKLVKLVLRVLKETRSDEVSQAIKVKG